MKLNKENNKLINSIYKGSYCIDCKHYSPDILSHLITIHDDLCLICDKCNSCFINDIHFDNHLLLCKKSCICF